MAIVDQNYPKSYPFAFPNKIRHEVTLLEIFMLTPAEIGENVKKEL